MANFVSPAYVTPSVTRGTVVALVPGDIPLSNPTKSISGHVYDTSGTAVVGATVILCRQYDGVGVRTTTSGAAGVYSFPRDTRDTYAYFVVAFSVSGGSTQVHGTSNRGLVPS